MYPENWTKKLQPFADAVGKTVEEISTALKVEVGEPGDAALDALSSEEFTPFESIKTALTSLGIPPAILRKNVGLLRTKKTTIAEDSANMFRMAAVLPPVPDDESFLKVLKLGGELKVGSTEIIAAVKAALANRVGLYDLPDLLKTKMEKFAEDLDEPCGTEFFDMRNLVIERNYAEVLSVLGIKGSFVTDSRKNTFLKKLESLLWDEVTGFQNLLAGWSRTWMETSSNPAMLAGTIASALGGSTVPGAMQIPPPDTAFLRDAAESAVNTINKVFAGIGIPIARALAYEAQQIKTVLENTKLPALVGAANRDQMLKILGTDVASDYVRLERNIVQYIIALIEYPKVEAGNAEIMYLTAMNQLGISINWDKLSGRTTTTKKAQQF